MCIFFALYKIIMKSPSYKQLKSPSFQEYFVILCTIYEAMMKKSIQTVFCFSLETLSPHTNLLHP